MPTITHCEESAATDGVGGAMPGLVPTEWPQLVSRTYFVAHNIICSERPDVYIEEYGPSETAPQGGTYDEHRVRLHYDGFYVVRAPAPVVG
ncbi:unnamed protein product [Urochloa decumbens]|uniref:Uncharacterized protein n=1 Tax=Urochloa decumbens TaxID=240449 RepID=A0ABC9EPF8_9POAL